MTSRDFRFNLMTIVVYRLPVIHKLILPPRQRRILRWKENSTVVQYELFFISRDFYASKRFDDCFQVNHYRKKNELCLLRTLFTMKEGTPSFVDTMSIFKRLIGRNENYNTKNLQIVIIELY